MKFGLAYGNTIPFSDPEPARRLVQAAERAGFESVWTVEHVIWPHDYDSAYPYHPSGKMPGDPSIPIPDPLIWLTWAAAATTTLRLGTGVIILPQRNPVVLAKALATLDHLSGGRVECGIGVGWLKEEFEALGIAFSGRGRRADEMIEAMRALWRDDRATYEGDSISFRDVALNPKPVERSIPIVVGGHSEAAARRAARFGDGFFPGPNSVEALAAIIAALHEECRAIGRDPDEIEISAVFPGRFMRAPQEAASTMRDLGVHRILIPVYEVARPDVDSGMAAFGEVRQSLG